MRCIINFQNDILISQYENNTLQNESQEHRRETSETTIPPQIWKNTDLEKKRCMKIILKINVSFELRCWMILVWVFHRQTRSMILLFQIFGAFGAFGAEKMILANHDFTVSDFRRLRRRKDDFSEPWFYSKLLKNFLTFFMNLLTPQCFVEKHCVSHFAVS